MVAEGRLAPTTRGETQVANFEQPNQPLEDLTAEKSQNMILRIKRRSCGTFHHSDG